MEIKFERTGSKGAFFYEKDRRRLAESTFSMAGEDKMIVDHTDVDESLKGQGVGLELVKAAVDHARKHQIKILPLCPFFRAMFNRHNEFQDVQV